MGLGNEYVEKLKTAYISRTKDVKNWNELENISHSASEEDLHNLLTHYPDTPKSLIEIIKIIDGTYHRLYGDSEICACFFGSLDGYPHYLFSAKEMMAVVPSDWVEECVDWNVKSDMPIDERITINYSDLKWLQFTDCINNGGTSQFYIDFSLSDKGKYGQIVSFVHDPDEFTVIADSFDDFLKLLIDGNFKFIYEDDRIFLYTNEKNEHSH